MTARGIDRAETAAAPRAGGVSHGGAGNCGADTAAAPIATMRERADFLAAARAQRANTPGAGLQARFRGADGGPEIRVGITCSKKVGNAVARNRAKRRLRAIAREVLPEHGRPGWDYVLVGRAVVTGSRDYARMRREIATAIDRLHGVAR